MPVLFKKRATEFKEKFFVAFSITLFLDVPIHLSAPTKSESKAYVLILAIYFSFFFIKHKDT